METNSLHLTISQIQRTTFPSIQLRPFRGSRLFTFHGKWIIFSHSPPTLSRSGYLSQGEGENEQVRLQCLGFTLNALQELLEESYTYSRRISVSKPNVHRAIPVTRDIVRWSLVSSRPSRDISTVILDSKKKEAIMNDIKEYLDPGTKMWYASHGIPYRRGYLFSGPPGTGKTSLASSLAGVFGLDIYVLSLTDPSITETHFSRLFVEVPSSCVVLLEDIDIAGINLKRRKHDKTSSDVVEPTTHGSKSSHMPVTLSGLLNAIDGVSSPEGRIFVMTTNAPQALDRALTRPGRVDLHIKFELPSREELRALFWTMFSDAPEVGTDGSDESDEKLETVPLDTLAVQFSERFPENRFSLADVQGFLLRHKRRPEEACARVADWIAESTDEMEAD